MPFTHTGTYLRVKVQGDWGYFHRQLVQDDLKMFLGGGLYHCHHGPDPPPHNPLDNRLQNITVMKKDDHLGLHSSEGKKTRRKRDWAAPKTKFGQK